ncbi:hypothetical protein [Nocardia bhagyanarayanae]|uniref:hypothetical protein n=1 Tax=Nocardia bhagyanarayanae TaxID=1215925 RepID=UPI00319DBFBD
MTLTAEAATSAAPMRRRAGLVPFVVTVFAFTVVMAGATMPTPLYGLYADRMGFEP